MIQYVYVASTQYKRTEIGTALALNTIGSSVESIFSSCIQYKHFVYRSHSLNRPGR